MTGHVWRLNALGERDDDAIDYQSDGVGHNGPICTVCGFGYCMWCPEPDGLDACPGPPQPAHQAAEYFESFETGGQQ